MNTARPNEAEMPQNKPAAAINKYPRMGCGLAGKGLINAALVESNDDLVTDHESGSGPAPIFINQVMHGLGIGTDVVVFKFDTPAREVGLGSAARRSARLAEHDYPLARHTRYETREALAEVQNNSIQVADVATAGVVGLRFGMDEDAEEFRHSLLEADFERRR